MSAPSLDKDILFYQAIQNILIGYYLNIVYSNSNLYLPQKNKILKSIIKSYLHKIKYKKIKRDLKGLLVFAKQPNFLLESKLLEIYELAEIYNIEVKDNSDLEKLYQSLNHIRKIYAVNIDATNISEIKDNNTIYVIKSDIFKSFNEKGDWKDKPIRLFIPIDKREQIVSYFNKTYLKVEDIKTLEPHSHRCLELTIG